MTDLGRALAPGNEVLYRHLDDQGATPQSETIAGVAGDSGLVSFIAPDPPPEPEPAPPIAFRLIEPVTDVEMGLLHEGDTVSKPFAIKLEPDMPVGSLKVYVNALAARNENNPPYSVFTNSGSDFAPANVPDGALTVRITAHTGSGGTGTLLHDTTIHLTVGTTEPNPPPPPPPNPAPGAWPSTVTSVLSPAALAFLTLPSGWTEKACDLFDTNIAQGDWGKPNSPTAFPAMTRGGRWRPTNPSYRDSSGRARYAGQDTCYVQGGELIEFIRSGVKGVTPFVHNAGGERMVSRPIPLWGPDATAVTLDSVSRRKGVRIDLLTKFPGIEANGYKVAYLLWAGPRINQVGYAEEDYPEFRFGAVNRVNAYHHHEGTVGGQVAYQLATASTDWHLYTMIFNAKGYKGSATGYSEFYLDGVLGGRRSTVNESAAALFYAKQTETWLKNEPVLPAPSSGKIYTRLFRVSEPT